MSTITTINASDAITTSRTVLNTNMANLNADKIETSYLSTDNTFASASDTKIPSQLAVKTYVDLGGNTNASTTVRGIVEEATQAEVDAGTAIGGTGARLFVNPSTALSTAPVVRTYLTAGSPATWTKPSRLRYVRVRVQAGGNGGDDNGGGGAGGYSEKVIAAASLGATETVTTGAGGLGHAATGSTGGGNSSFGAHSTANGGGGRTGGTAASGNVNIQGGDGSASFQTDSATARGVGGYGGNSIMGFGGVLQGDYASNISGASARGYGGGGGGSNGTGAGENGGNGIIIVEEYYL